MPGGLSLGMTRQASMNHRQNAGLSAIETAFAGA